ncbi:hypothetical protein [Paenibacillus aestuarii]|uniref:Uncharacterized protein n=1 Tax=Paenibacillus aestuarii TaxID=516965 RepID=A0ABW0K3N6_9BACL|nr:hypothetical protein [Paenibacillus aestuarii]
MVRSRVKTYRYRMGKNNFIVIKIYQSAKAAAEQGNVLASNALNIQIIKNAAKNRKRTNKSKKKR